jgi:DNA-binding NtrC family response regulator
MIDLRMPGMDGLELLNRLLKIDPHLPVVLLTAYGSVGSAVAAMKHGAFDYLTKPADNDEIKAVAARALEHRRLAEESLKAPDRRAEDEGPALVGESPAMMRLNELLEQAGPSEATVLIQGESGTGKELVAERLHALSPRRHGPLIKVNCAALPTNLLESELFGHSKGAFTGAVRDRPGRFQLAHGGSLFLDEISEMDLAVQAKLLRAIQEKTVEPLGAARTVHTDVRILAAANRNLKELVEKGEFREDLFYRLAVLEAPIPPLRDRLADLPLLTAHFLRQLGEKNRKQARNVSPAFMEALKRHSWPGNVRELMNVLERALILARSDTLGPELLPPQLSESAAFSQTEGPAPSSGETEADPLETAEREALIKTLEANDYHRQRTADALGVSRRTLQYKLKKHGLTNR